MEMNFPHKELDQVASEDSAIVVDQSVDHQALLAYAIARQASSQSARYYYAASKGLPSSRATTRGSFMDDRMAFFAGRVRLDISERGKTKLFNTGCFRPDLAHRESNDMHG
jgi:hypothetical protein